MLRSKKGFTLIELIVCIFIIVILLAITVPFIAGISQTTKTKQVEVITQEQEATLNEKEDTKIQPPLKQEEVKSTDKGIGKTL